MPVYVYEREDGSQFEVKQSIVDSPLDVCPNTGQKVKRVIQPAGLAFKGSGWYVTDYKNTKKPKKEDGKLKESKSPKKELGS